ncbi:putative uncharacterized protein DDB_G0285119 isoform X2 [Drosophila virilis]|uniref:putative uncharacterized protein DDB_G0285119 isoform X2 n=1 Tax=Drosophila virilis TaxID=7244 RepID=UPI0038B3D1F0
MAPFKLKFRMGSSRSTSTSQEHDPDPTVNEALLGTQQQEQELNQQQQQHHQQQQQHQAVGASSSTIDSVDCNSVGSMSERKLLLPPNPSKAGNNSNSLRMGYVNPSRTPCISETATATDSNKVPTTPPPTYEYVLEENTRLSQHQRQLSSENSATPNQNSRRSSANSSRQSAAHLSAALEQLTLNDSSNSNSNSDSDSNDICNDPDCQQNYNNSGNCGSRNNNNNSNNNNNRSNNNNDGEQLEQREQQIHPHIIEGVTELDLEHSENEECTLSVNEFLLETEMAASRANKDNLYAACSDASEGQQPCTDAECTECGEQAACGSGHLGMESEEDGEEPSTSNAARHNFYDPLLNRYGSEPGCSNGAASGNSSAQSCNEACCASGSGSTSVSSRSRRGRRQQQQQQQQQEQSCLLTPEMMSNKTSKEIYKDLAKQWGITCKMSESCRCMDCQSHYFDCDYDDNEHQKTDGGLGAGTPMFISERLLNKCYM